MKRIIILILACIATTSFAATGSTGTSTGTSSDGVTTTTPSGTTNDTTTTIPQTNTNIPGAGVDQTSPGTINPANPNESSTPSTTH